MVFKKMNFRVRVLCYSSHLTCHRENVQSSGLHISPALLFTCEVPLVSSPLVYFLAVLLIIIPSLLQAMVKMFRKNFFHFTVAILDGRKTSPDKLVSQPQNCTPNVVTQILN